MDKPKLLRSEGFGTVMKAESQKRRTEITFFVSEEELKQIRNRRDSLGIHNMSAYLRKMAIDGYILKLNLPEIKEAISLLRSISNNVNQIAKRVNASNKVYKVELEQIRMMLQELWEQLGKALKQLSQMN